MKSEIEKIIADSCLMLDAENGLSHHSDNDKTQLLEAHVHYLSVAILKEIKKECLTASLKAYRTLGAMFARIEVLDRSDFEGDITIGWLAKDLREAKLRITQLEQELKDMALDAIVDKVRES